MKNKLRKNFRYILAVLIVLAIFLPVVVQSYTSTSNLALKKPSAPSETGWGPMLNDNSDTLDDAALANENGISGRLATWTGPHSLDSTTFSLGAVVLLTGVQTLVDKVLTAPTINDPTISSPIITTKLRYPSGTAFPGSPSAGDTIIITDDSAAGACDSAAGSASTLCRYNGSSWASISGTGSTMPFIDNTALLKNSADATKTARFSLSGITPSTLRVYTMPDVDGTLTLLAATQTITNKTINTASNTVQIAGQTISSMSGTGSGKVMGASGSFTEDDILIADANGNAVSSTISIPFSDAMDLIKNSSDSTKLAKFRLTNLPTTTTRIYDLPAFASGELAMVRRTPTPFAGSIAVFDSDGALVSSGVSITPTPTSTPTNTPTASPTPTVTPTPTATPTPTPSGGGTIFAASTGTSTTTSGAPLYFAISGISTTSATESDVQMYMPAGDYSDLHCELVTPSSSSAGFTFQFVLNNGGTLFQCDAFDPDSDCDFAGPTALGAGLMDIVMYPSGSATTSAGKCTFTFTP